MNFANLIVEAVGHVVNKAIISGGVSRYSPEDFMDRERGGWQTSLTLVLDKAGYKTFVPVLVMGTKKTAEVAETINGGDYLIMGGRWPGEPRRPKESGERVVVDVERLRPRP